MRVKRCAATIKNRGVSYPCLREAAHQRDDGRWFCRECFKQDQAGECVHVSKGEFPMRRCPKCGEYAYTDDLNFLKAREVRIKHHA